MKIQQWTFFSVLILFLSALQVSAAEIYSFVTRSCQLHEGLLVQFQNETVEMLTLQGGSVSIPQSEIQALLIHNVVENPIAQVQLNAELARRLKQVHMFNEDQPRFEGWSVKFVEDLAIFFDLTGKTHVVEISQISKIRPAQQSKKVFQMKSQAVQLSIGDLSTSCENLRKRTSGVRPSRILSNQIQIEETLASFEKGFRAIDGHEERTYFYPRPLMFDSATRMGFPFLSESVQRPSEGGFYFKWGSGQAFRYQSLFQFLGGTVEWLPNFEPMMVFRSEVKSHLFHASLVAHLPSIAAGSSAFSGYFMDAAEPFKKSAIYSGSTYKSEDKSFVMHSFNYMGLMGFDLGPWSFSAGPFFPVVMYFAQQQYREVLSNTMGPTVRLMHTTKYTRARIVVGSSNNSSSSATTKDINTNVSSHQDSNWPTLSFSSKFDFLRAGFDYEFGEDIKVTAEMGLVRANYEELNRANRKNTLSYENQILSLGVGKRFGDYVSLGMIYTRHRISNRFDFTGAETDNRTPATTGAYFEFIF